MAEAGDFIFNCQMGRGRTTTGMVSACLISSTLGWDPKAESVSEITEESQLLYNHLDGPSDEEVYLAGK